MALVLDRTYQRGQFVNRRAEASHAAGQLHHHIAATAAQHIDVLGGCDGQNCTLDRWRCQRGGQDDRLHIRRDTIQFVDVADAHMLDWAEKFAGQGQQWRPPEPVAISLDHRDQRRSVALRGSGDMLPPCGLLDG